MLTDIPFSYRVGLLFGLMVLVAGIDLYRFGAKATKFREYGFILFAGAIGALVGFVNDLITASISPEYFMLGKGLSEGNELQMQAAILGLKAGCSAGTIAGAACLYVGMRKSKSPPIAFGFLFRSVWLPICAAIVVAVILPNIVGRFDPANFSANLSALISEEKIQYFRFVWWAHTGLYAGLCVGVVAVLFRITQLRRAQNPVDRSQRRAYSDSV